MSVIDTTATFPAPPEEQIEAAAKDLAGVLTRHQVPVCGEPVPTPLASLDRPVPYDCLLVRSTPALWNAVNSYHATLITSLVDAERAQREIANRREEANRQRQEQNRRIAAAMEAVCVGPGEQPKQDLKSCPEANLDWACKWVELGRVLRECDRLRDGYIGEFLHKLETTSVRPLAAVAALLLLSQEGQPDNVGRSLTLLSSEPAMRDTVELLRWICNALIDGIPDLGLLLHWVRMEGMQTVMRALGCRILGPEQMMETTPRTVLPETPQKLLECVELERNEFLKRATRNGLPGRGVRVDTPGEGVAFIRDQLDGDTILPCLERLWVAAAALNLKPLPPFAGEPRSITAAIEAYETLAEWLRAAIGQATPSMANRGGERGGDTPNPSSTELSTVERADITTIDWQALLLMPPLCPAEIADKLGEPVEHVERTLRYFRTQHDYGFVKDDDAGRTTYRYKMPDVLSHLQKWVVKRLKKRAKHAPADR
jgi:hypothetical protein